MTYKTNTPTYKSKSVNNFSDFIDNIESEKKELEETKKGMNKNHTDTQQYPKNSKLKFNKVTRKMDDMTLPEIEDKIDSIEDLQESLSPELSNVLNSLSRFIDDYDKTHNNFEKRGLDEGLEIIRNSDNLDDAIKEIKDKIKQWQSGEKGDLMPGEQKEDIVEGLKDLLKNIKPDVVEENKRILKFSNFKN